MWSQEHERRAAEMRQRNERDRVASPVGQQLRIAEATGISGALERHYSPQELAAIWQVSTDTIRRIFRDEPGVLKIGQVGARRRQRSHVTLRIPETVVQRVHRRLTVL